MAYPMPNRRPINVGGAGTTFGGMPSLPFGMQPPPPPPQLPQEARDIAGEARRFGMAEALENPVSVESGGWGEALAEALGSGLRGRVARGDRRSELEQEERQRTAISEALAGFDPQNAGAIVDRLRQGAPAEALDFAQALIPRQSSQQQEQWSEPFELGGALVRRNLQTNETVQVVPRRPASQQGQQSYPDDGYDYEN